MRVYNSERNIKLRDIPRILFNKKKAINFLQDLFLNKEIILTNYGRSAFELILEENNIKDCKVMIPGFICPLFKEIFERRNIESILIDVDLNTWNISEKALKKEFDSKARCLIINNMNGLPAEFEKIKKMCGRMPIIEDCAHALGSFHNKKVVGYLGDSSFFSFYKNLPTISGGFVVLSSKKERETKNKEKLNIHILMKLFYFIGNNANFYRRFLGKVNLENKSWNFKRFEILSPNRITNKLINYYIFNIKKNINKRQKVAKELINGLSGLDLIFQKNPFNEHIYTYFGFLLPKEFNRENFLKELQNYGISPRLIWDHPLSKELNSKSCPISNEISERIVNLPLSPNYSKKDIHHLISSVKKSLSLV